MLSSRVGFTRSTFGRSHPCWIPWRIAATCCLRITAISLNPEGQQLCPSCGRCSAVVCLEARSTCYGTGVGIVGRGESSWHSMLRHGQYSHDGGRLFILRSPTGFPLATMEISEGRAEVQTLFRAAHCGSGQVDQGTSDRKVRNGQRKTVYWEYVEKVGEEDCDDAVLNYLDPARFGDPAGVRLYRRQMDWRSSSVITSICDEEWEE